MGGNGVLGGLVFGGCCCFFWVLRFDFCFVWFIVLIYWSFDVGF